MLLANSKSMPRAWPWTPQAYSAPIRNGRVLTERLGSATLSQCALGSGTNGGTVGFCG
jgi:hypothetical protein